jgi:hypothetical protein
MLVVSGTHGVEGYYGSDCQIAWLDTLDEKALPADTAVLLIHLLNPWGAAHLRRVNEDNIDLNRNFIDFNQPVPANPDYANWHGIYHGDRYSADRQLAEALGNVGWQALKPVVEAGQYAAAEGFSLVVISRPGRITPWRRLSTNIFGRRKPSSVLTCIPVTGHGGIRCCCRLQNSVMSRMTGVRQFTGNG